jgi:hypothetical protein
MKAVTVFTVITSILFCFFATSSLALEIAYQDNPYVLLDRLLIGQGSSPWVSSSGKGIGTYTNNSQLWGIGGGIVLSSGDVRAFEDGPNTSSAWSVNLSYAGDSDLTDLSGYPTFGGHEQISKTCTNDRNKGCSQDSNCGIGTCGWENPGDASMAKWSAFDDVFDPFNGVLSCQRFSTAGLPNECQSANYGDTVYYCDYKYARFFVLNNDYDPYQSTGSVGHEIGRCQREWVERNLVGNNMTHNFFFHHEAAYGSGAHGRPPSAMDQKPYQRNMYIQLIGGNNATMLFSGHEHQYTRRPITNNFANNRINKGIGPRTAESYDGANGHGDLNKAPLLHIEWQDGTVDTTLDRRVQSSNDDAEESSDGTVYLNSSDLEFMYDNGLQSFVGMRWINIDIPKNATIKKAYIQFTTDEVSSYPVEIRFYGESADNAQQFSSVLYNLTNRPRTTNYKNWGIPGWGSEGERGENQRTPDLSTIIQEIVNRNGWQRNNAIVILATYQILDVNFTGDFYEVKTGSSGAPWYVDAENDYMKNIVKYLTTLFPPWEIHTNEPYHYAVVDVYPDNDLALYVYAVDRNGNKVPIDEPPQSGGRTANIATATGRGPVTVTLEDEPASYFGEIDTTADMDPSLNQATTR